MDRLRSLIAEKSKNLSSIEIPYELEMDFLEDFLKEYNAYNFDSYDNVSNVAYLMAILVSNNINMSFYELVEQIKIIQDFVNEADFDYALYNRYLENLLELNNLNLLKKINNNEKLNKLDSKIKKVYNEYRKNSKKLFTLEIDDKEQYDYRINIAFNKLFVALPNPEYFKSFLNMHIIVDELKVMLKEYYDEELSDASKDSIFSELEQSLFKGRNFNRFVEKEKRKLINLRIKQFIEINKITLFEEYDAIRKYYEKIVKEAKDIVKKTNKQIKSLEELDYKLKYVNPDRLLKIDSIEGLIIDDEIKYNYLLFVLEHNNAIYKKEEEKNIEFNNNGFNKLEILFSKYGFNFNDFNEEEKTNIINNTTHNQVETILNSIKYSELLFISDYVSEFAKIIVSSKPEIIKFIDVLLKNKIIDKKFIFKNINILCDTNEYNNLYNNIKCLSDVGINLNNLFKDNQDILLSNNQKLIEKINILNEYQLKLNKEDVYNFKILKDDSMLDLLDNFIELGLKDIILENPKYLDVNGFDIIKRIMICNLIGINPINKSNKIIGSINTGNNFYLEPKDYDNFIIDYKEDYQNPLCVNVLKANPCTIISSSIKNHNFIKKLDELYMKDELTYIINGVIISRNRVLRNLEVLSNNLSHNDIDISDLVYQAVLYKMVNNIEPDVLEQIYNSICTIGLEIENNKIYTLK